MRTDAPTLSVAGTSKRLDKLLARPVVAIVGTRHSTHYARKRRALELGREVAAVPGRIADESAGGPNRLIREGAHPILETKDALDLLA